MALFFVIFNMLKIQKINDELFKHREKDCPMHFYMAIHDGKYLRVIDSHSCPPEHTTGNWPVDYFTEDLNQFSVEEWVSKIKSLILSCKR